VKTTELDCLHQTFLVLKIEIYADIKKAERIIDANIKWIEKQLEQKRG
jgi:hypothetical protein